MYFKPFFKLIFFVLITSFLLIGCGEKTKKDNEEPLYPTQKSETPKNQIVINSNDQMQFDLKEIKVKPNTEVTVKLNHTGNLPANVMGHNFVLLKKGVDLVDFATQAASQKEQQYIPENTNDIIAYTKLLGGGESTTVTFTTPEKGTYDFICSFPGHYGIMQGKFIVE